MTSIWVISDDSDYYGPDLCRDFPAFSTKEQAEQFIEIICPCLEYSRTRHSFLIDEFEVASCPVDAAVEHAEWLLSNVTWHDVTRAAAARSLIEVAETVAEEHGPRVGHFGQS